MVQDEENRYWGERSIEKTAVSGRDFRLSVVKITTG
jgi:hypothetical protein